MKTLLIAVLATAASLVHAAPGADLQAGKRLVEEKCTTCHAKQVGGDGSKIYTRKESQIRTAALLSQQMQMCDSMGHGHLSDAERNNVMAWLNQQYYHFK